MTASPNVLVKVGHKWHIVAPGGTSIACSDGTFDPASVKHKRTVRGGITCKACDKLVRAYKAVKL